MIYELLVLFYDRGQSSQDECHGVEVRRYLGSLFLELMMILISFQNVSVAFFLDVSIEVKKGGYIELS